MDKLHTLLRAPPQKKRSSGVKEGAGWREKGDGERMRGWGFLRSNAELGLSLGLNLPGAVWRLLQMFRDCCSEPFDPSGECQVEKT